MRSASTRSTGRVAPSSGTTCSALSHTTGGTSGRSATAALIPADVLGEVAAGAGAREAARPRRGATISTAAGDAERLGSAARERAVLIARREGRPASAGHSSAGGQQRGGAAAAGAGAGARPG